MIMSSANCDAEQRENNKCWTSREHDTLAAGSDNGDQKVLDGTDVRGRGRGGKLLLPFSF